MEIDDRTRARARHDVPRLRLGALSPLALRLKRPEDAALAGPPECAPHGRVDHAPRRPEVTRRDSRLLPDRVVAARDLLVRAAGTAEPEAPVRPRVVGDLVAAVGDRPHDL